MWKIRFYIYLDKEIEMLLIEEHLISRYREYSIKCCGHHQVRGKPFLLRIEILTEYIWFYQ